MSEADHTRIDIQTDPTKRRMSGIATHGHTPFDCPIITNIDGNLWQGGCEEGLILPPNIRHLISLYPWEKYRLRDRGQLETEVYIRAYDAEPGHIESMLDSLASLALECLAKGPTLIHCQAGLNRSGLLSALVLMRRGMTADDAIALMRRQRSPAVLCNQSFVEWLRKKKVA